MAKEIICRNCGTLGTPKSRTPGNFGIELLLWLLFILPGVIYSVWRLASIHKACRKCGSKELVPTDTPAGRQLLEQFGHTK